MPRRSSLCRMVSMQFPSSLEVDSILKEVWIILYDSSLVMLWILSDGHPTFTEMFAFWSINFVMWNIQMLDISSDPSRHLDQNFIKMFGWRLFRSSKQFSLYFVDNIRHSKYENRDTDANCGDYRYIIWLNLYRTGDFKFFWCSNWKWNEHFWPKCKNFVICSFLMFQFQFEST